MLPELLQQDGIKLIETGDGYKALCPYHDEKTPSFSLYRSAKGWKYHCFGCKESGDTVDYLHKIRGMSMHEALNVVKGKQTAVSKKQPQHNHQKQVKIIGALPSNHVSRHTYRDEAGNVVFVVQKYMDRETGKKYFGQYTPHNNQWQKGLTMGQNRPLYGLFTFLRSDKERPVMVVEGEKCADLVRKNFKKTIVVSWCGGTGSWKRTDFSPLFGRKLMLVADSDVQGYLCMNDIALYMEKKCQSIILVLPELTKMDEKSVDIGDIIEDDRKKTGDWIKEHSHRFDNELKEKMVKLANWNKQREQKKLDLKKTARAISVNEYFEILGLSMFHKVRFKLTSTEIELEFSREELTKKANLKTLCADMHWWQRNFSDLSTISEHLINIARGMKQ